MATKCEVFGWLLVDDAARVLVREESGHISLQSAKPDSAPGHWAIQTGSFRRGKPIGLGIPAEPLFRSLRDGVGCEPAGRGQRVSFTGAF